MSMLTTIYKADQNLSDKADQNSQSRPEFAKPAK
jgi:hypothetical protein